MSTPVAVEVTDVTTIVLDATHRCDRCGAQAYAVTQHADSELLWCAHHFNQHEAALGDTKVVDDRNKIYKEAPVSSY